MSKFSTWAINFPGTGDDAVDTQREMIANRVLVDKEIAERKEIRIPTPLKPLDKAELVEKDAQNKQNKIIRMENDIKLIKKNISDKQAFINEVKIFQEEIKTKATFQERKKYIDQKTDALQEKIEIHKKELRKMVNFDDAPQKIEKINDLGSALKLIKKMNYKTLEYINSHTEDEINKNIEKNQATINNYFHELDEASLELENYTTINFNPFTLPVSVTYNNQIFVDRAQGVGSKTLDPMNMDPKTGKTSTIASYFTRFVSFITGKGEKQNVQYYIEQLKRARDNGELPERIVLNGHSRGACTCIEFSRAIYEEFGHDIKIAINITDPVPGSGNLAESKMVVPPNVDSLVITYSENENSLSIMSVTVPLDRIIVPQTLDEFCFGKETTVTSSTLPMNHKFDAQPGTWSDNKHTMQSIANNMWYAIDKREKDMNFDDIKKYGTQCDPSIPLTDPRADKELVIATNPYDNINLPSELKEYHRQLQNNLYTPETELKYLRKEQYQPDRSTSSALSNYIKLKNDELKPLEEKNKAYKEAFNEIQKEELKKLTPKDKLNKSKVKKVEKKVLTALAKQTKENKADKAKINKIRNEIKVARQAELKIRYQDWQSEKILKQIQNETPKEMPNNIIKELNNQGSMHKKVEFLRTQLKSPELKQNEYLYKLTKNLFNLLEKKEKIEFQYFQYKDKSKTETVESETGIFLGLNDKNTSKAQEDASNIVEAGKQISRTSSQPLVVTATKQNNKETADIIAPTPTSKPTSTPTLSRS